MLCLYCKCLCCSRTLQRPDQRQHRDREQCESASAEVFSIPGPFFTDVNYSNDQEEDCAHPGQDPISPEGEGERTKRQGRGRKGGNGQGRKQGG